MAMGARDVGGAGLILGVLIAAHMYLESFALPFVVVVVQTGLSLVAYACVLLIYALSVLAVKPGTRGLILRMDRAEMSKQLFATMPNAARRLQRSHLRLLWCVLYLAEVGLYMERPDPSEPWDISKLPMAWQVFNLTMSVFVCADLALGYAAEPRKGTYATSAETAADFCICPIVFLAFTAFSREDEYLRALVRFGYVRMLALLDTGAYEAPLRGLDEISLLLVQTVVQLTALTLLFAGFFYEMESPDHARGFTDYGDFLYFMFITMSTVGYGDWSPTLWQTRWVAMLCIVLVVTFVPSTLGELAQLLTSPKRRRGALPRPGRPHFVLVGDMESHQLDLLLRDLYGRYAASSDAAVPVLTALPAALPPTLVLTSRPLEGYDHAAIARRYRGRVCLMRGDVLSDDLGVLERLGLHGAIAIFVIASAEHESTAQERADERAVLTALALAKYAKACVPQMFVQINRAELRKTLLDVGIKHVIAQNVLKMQLLGKCAAGCHGLSTVVSAVFLLDEEEEHTRSDGGRPPPHDEPWMQEYAGSWQWELYTMRVPPELAGLTFGICAVALYSHTKGQLLPIGVAESESEWLGLNCALREVEAGEELVVLGESAEAVAALTEQPPSAEAIERARSMLHAGGPATAEYDEDSMLQLAEAAATHASQVEQALLHRKHSVGSSLLRGRSRTGSLTDEDALPKFGLQGPTHPQAMHWTDPVELFGESTGRSSDSAGGAPDANGARSPPGASLEKFRSMRARRQSRAAVDRSANFKSMHVVNKGTTRELRDVVIDDARSDVLPGELILICGWPGNLGALMETAAALVRWRIVVLAPSEPDDDGASMLALQTIPRAFFVRGSPLVDDDLERAGIQFAASVLLFGGENLARRRSSAAEAKGDRHAVLAFAKIHAVLRSLRASGAAIGPPCQVIVELDDLRSVRFLDDGREWWPAEDSFGNYLQSPPIASGAAYADEMACTMVTANFYVPLLVKVLHRLVGDERAAGIEQLPIPPAFGELTFAELFEKMAAEGFLVIGLYCPMGSPTGGSGTRVLARGGTLGGAASSALLGAARGGDGSMRAAAAAAADGTTPPRSVNLVRNVLSAFQNFRPSALPQEEDNDLSFTLINPPPSRIVRQYDRMFVLARDGFTTSKRQREKARKASLDGGARTSASSAANASSLGGSCRTSAAGSRASSGGLGSAWARARAALASASVTPLGTPRHSCQPTIDETVEGSEGPFSPPAAGPAPAQPPSVLTLPPGAAPVTRGHASGAHDGAAGGAGGAGRMSILKRRGDGEPPGSPGGVAPAPAPRPSKISFQQESDSQRSSQRSAESSADFSPAFPSRALQHAPDLGVPDAIAEAPPESEGGSAGATGPTERRSLDEMMESPGMVSRLSGTGGGAAALAAARREDALLARTAGSLPGATETRAPAESGPPSSEAAHGMPGAQAGGAL